MFVASTVSGRQTRSSSANSSRFGSSSSTIASITTSQSSNAERSVVRLSRPMSKESIWAFSTLRVRKWSIRPRALSPSSSVTSRPTVWRPRLDGELRDARAHRAQPYDSDLHRPEPNDLRARDGAPPARARGLSGVARPFPGRPCAARDRGRDGRGSARTPRPQKEPAPCVGCVSPVPVWRHSPSSFSEKQAPVEPVEGVDNRRRVAHMEVSEGTVPFGEAETWYRVTGELGPRDTAAPAPLVVLHGGPGGTHDYLLSLADLADERAVVHYDQVGGGRSTHYPDRGAEFWTVDLFVARAAQPRRRARDRRSRTTSSASPGAGSSRRSTRSRSRPGCAPRPRRHGRVVGRLRRGGRQAARGASGATCWRRSTGTRPRARTTTRSTWRPASCSTRVTSAEIEWPPEVTATFEWLERDPTVYRTMNGPSEFHIIGSCKDWQVKDRLHEIRVPTLIVSDATTRRRRRCSTCCSRASRTRSGSCSRTPPTCRTSRSGSATCRSSAAGSRSTTDPQAGLSSGR